MVEVQNLFQGYSRTWDWVTKENTARLSNRCHARLVLEARQHFDGFGLDFEQYGDAVVVLHDEITAQVEWEHNVSGKKITLLQVWFDKKTGAIHQCGHNYGDLVS